MIKTLKSAFAVLAAGFIMASCSTPKNITYIQDFNDRQTIQIASAAENALKIVPFNKLSIIVSCKDPALARMFNLNVFTNTQAHRSGESGPGSSFNGYDVGYSDGISGYTVSAQGTIDFPILGELKVEGMTRSELAAFIKGEIVGRGFINDPIVTVEFINVGYNMLGEVGRPGRYDINTDVVTLIDAISQAGDVSIQGRRDKVKVLRREGDKVTAYTVDLTDAESVMNSPVYYLKQGDVVYVEPNDIRKRQATVNGNNVMNVSFWLSVASLITTAAVLLKN